MFDRRSCRFEKCSSLSSLSLYIYFTMNSMNIWYGVRVYNVALALPSIYIFFCIECLNRQKYRPIHIMCLCLQMSRECALCFVHSFQTLCVSVIDFVCDILFLLLMFVRMFFVRHYFICVTLFCFGCVCVFVIYSIEFQLSTERDWEILTEKGDTKTHKKKRNIDKGKKREKI